MKDVQPKRDATATVLNHAFKQAKMFELMNGKAMTANEAFAAFGKEVQCDKQEHMSCLLSDLYHTGRLERTKLEPGKRRDGCMYEYFRTKEDYDGSHKSKSKPRISKKKRASRGKKATLQDAINMMLEAVAIIEEAAQDCAEMKDKWEELDNLIKGGK